MYLSVEHCGLGHDDIDRCDSEMEYAGDVEERRQDVISHLIEETSGDGRQVTTCQCNFCGRWCVSWRGRPRTPRHPLGTGMDVRVQRAVLMWV
jgi:hypothetical protein